MVRGTIAYYTLIISEFTVDTRMNRDKRLTEARLQHAILTYRD